MLLPWGRSRSKSGDFLVDDEAGSKIVQAFLEAGVDLPIDYEHQTLGGEYASPDGRAPAAGWIKQLEVIPGVGIFAQVEWTARAAGVLSSKEYRYLSPVVIAQGPDSRAEYLHSAALTNVPAIAGAAAIINSAPYPRHMETSGMNRQTVHSALGESLTAMMHIAVSADEQNPRKLLDQIIELLEASLTEDEMEIRNCVEPAIAGLRAFSEWIDGAALLMNSRRPVNMNNLRRSINSARAGLIGRNGRQARTAAGSVRRPAGGAARSRESVIANANARFTAESAHPYTMVCSRRAWVNTSLRDAGLLPMSDTEAAAIAREELHHAVQAKADSAATAAPGASREEIIELARSTFAENREELSIVTSEKAFVNGALLEAGQARLTELELQEYPLLSE